MKLTALAVVVLVVAWRWWRYRNPPLRSWGPRVDPDSPGEIVRRALAGRRSPDPVWTGEPVDLHTDGQWKIVAWYSTYSDGTREPHPLPPHDPTSGLGWLRRRRT